MNFEPVIGLEIHVQMKTRSKMFSSSPNSFSHEPNTEVTPFDMAYPGTMPRVNKQAVINAIRVANALHMTIDPLVRFDRKNYFYSDLPKGFQITQQFHPIGRDGYLDILDEHGNSKRVRIERIHMEEDTCKQVHFPDCSLLDYNRAGTPLVEIVSMPDIASGTEAMHYVEAIRNIVVYSLTSDGKMEEGSLRCDVNVSLRPVGYKGFGTKVELKNLNSIKNIQLALDYEIKRQEACLLSSTPIAQETRRFDEASGKTVLMRVKTDAVDYKYFPEPNIAPILLSEQFVKDAIDSCPELYEEKKERYLKLGLPLQDVEVILSSLQLASYFEKALEDGGNAKAIANFLLGEVLGYLNKKGKGLSEIGVEASLLSSCAKKQDEGYSHKQCADALIYCLDHLCGVDEAFEALHIQKQVSDEGAIKALVEQVLEANPKSIADYKSGNGRAMGFLIGQCMKLGKGKVSPQAVSKVMAEELEKR